MPEEEDVGRLRVTRGGDWAEPASGQKGSEFLRKLRVLSRETENAKGIKSLAMSGRERLAVYVLAALALAGFGLSIYRSRFASPPVEVLRETEVKEVGVDINSAEAWELALLPGIGEKLAERIIQYRQTHGPFRNVRDLANVQGIGESMIGKLEPYVRISAAKDDAATLRVNDDGR